MKVYESATEAADAIGVSVQTVTDWIKSRQLPAERIRRAGRRGRPGFRILHTDLIEASRGTLFEQPSQVPQLSFDTPEDQRRAALTLQVLWPTEQRSLPFSFDLLSGFRTLRALTYTISLPFILKLLTTQDYDWAEILFGSESLVRASDAAKVVLLQGAIRDEVARGYLGIGGDTDPRTKQLMDMQADGRARFLAAAGGVVHSKLYFLERPGLRRALVGSANLSERAMSGNTISG